MGFVNGAWFQWLEHQKQLKDHILIPKQPDNIMIAKIAENRVIRPKLGKDNILYELQLQSFVESYEAEKLRLHRDYQAFVQAQEKLND